MENEIPGANEISSDLADSLLIHKNEEQENIISLISEAEQIKETKLAKENEERFIQIPAGRELYLTEAFISDTAEEFYAYYIRKAKNYIKTYCKAYGLVQKWIRRKTIGGVNYKYTDKYDPSVYKLQLIKRDSRQVVYESRVRATADEAAEEVANILDFRRSTEYLGILKDFNEFTMDAISKEEKYIKRIVEIKRLEELKTQILSENNNSITYMLRTRWVDEINDKIYALKGAF